MGQPWDIWTLHWGLKRLGVDPPMCSSRACLRAAFTAILLHRWGGGGQSFKGRGGSGGTPEEAWAIAISTKRRKEIVSGLEDHRYLSVTNTETRR